ncbi:ClpXP protease specificity-enhancing factor [Polynucleobacter paneuropaeus]|nr:ClpXP protease specificity-enhancing factor [Polynucleobacter paneuropaeus]MBT8544563.1 ClpXP protease specificity-enhancing factor [Polynucleobacter paneuropaeus]MBT8555379.1 ClpXP protease specificity-enhancing factor [Polynucleobacter paneuropaeus]MBT8560655.1 ClpXP protease specificity-enhancing factor [Polynucleobacter paneuropaeus]
MSDVPSNKPYLIRALHQWCADFGFTPFIAVFVDQNVEVPMEFVKKDEIVLNLSAEACHNLQIENDWISFQARFGGVPKKILVPISHVLAIYARENGQGMSFPFDPNQAKTQNRPSEQGGSDEPPKSNRPSLKIVK